MDKVKRLRGVSLDWKENGERDIGLIAEEVGEVVPEIVAYEENGKDARSLDYARLTPLLVEGVKEEQAQIAGLQTQLTAVAGRLKRLDHEELVAAAPTASNEVGPRVKSTPSGEF